MLDRDEQILGFRKRHTKMTSYEGPRDNNRSQQSSQFEREADPHSQDAPSLDEISLSTTPVSQIIITIPMIMTLETMQILHA